MRKEKEAFVFSNQELQECVIRHKFEEQETKKAFLEVYEELLLAIRPSYYIVKEEMQGFVVMTLGESVDQLQDAYLQKEEYLKAYSVDCLGMEFLMKFYELLKQELKEEKQYIQQFLYPGEQLPIERIKEILEKTKATDITYNEAFVMKPKKSVAMKLILTNRQERETCGICAQCQNKTCTARRK